ncbi:two-component sensor histidine kinase [Cellulomonas sp. APG4]|uniref:sensor histidine kinase n=1 Tax=Cellulomonas sp. APG4 TaxID=1538656 RepID=UPI00137AA759|nr:histidine kinase [Cellulomonas sp. APG4]NCT90804.1 two-component sensor histidine kinase [Cellulomonas sp. APG4]
MDKGRAAMGWIRRHPATSDLVLGAGLTLLFVIGAMAAPGWLDEGAPVDLTLTPPGVALTVLTGAALTQRRRRPAATLVVATAATAASVAAGWQVHLAPLALALTMYGYTVRSNRARALVAAGAAAITVGIGGVVAGVRRDDWDRLDTIILLVGTSTAIALAVQARRATIAALEDRARRAEESREATARRRVAEERVTIARELHDVIAHHVAVMSVHSGVAEHLLERDPAAARAAIGHVRDAGRAVLSELQSVLGVLRQDETALPTAPAPGLAALEGLLASFRATGAPLETRIPTPLPVLPPAVDAAALRLVQEALTNVQKHAAAASTTVRLEVDGGSVLVVVTNARPPDRSPTPDPGGPDVPDTRPGSGLGLVGMRERVVAAGGSLETGPTPHGGFMVAARLPLTQEDR